MSKENFSYPLDPSWSTADIVAVTALFSAVADANETGVDRDELMASYKAFKEVVPMKFEEKQLDKDFEAESGYSIYRTIKAARDSSRKQIKLQN